MSHAYREVPVSRAQSGMRWDDFCNNCGLVDLYFRDVFLKVFEVDLEFDNN